MRAPAYEAALHDARLYPQLWRLLLGTVLILFFYVTVAGALLAGIFAIAGKIAPASVIHISAGLRGIQAAMSGYGGLDTPVPVLLILITFAGLFLGPMLAAAAFHFRGPGSLFGDPQDWLQGFLTALAVQLPLLGILVAVGILLDPPDPGLALDRWIALLPLALPLILLQTGAEELLFRGYFQQQLAARFAARWVWMGLPAVTFALLHWSPAAGPNLPVVLLSALTFGLIAADLSEQTGSLGAAMGLHFGNNMIGILILAPAGTITGLARWISPAPLDTVGTETLGMLASILVMLAVWRITRRILTR